MPDSIMPIVLDYSLVGHLPLLLLSFWVYPLCKVIHCLESLILERDDTFNRRLLCSGPRNGSSMPHKMSAIGIEDVDLGIGAYEHLIIELKVYTD